VLAKSSNSKVHITEPRERTEGFGSTPRKAIDAALAQENKA
jgi:hypothetical protein